MLKWYYLGNRRSTGTTPTRWQETKTGQLRAALTLHGDGAMAGVLLQGGRRALHRLAWLGYPKLRAFSRLSSCASHRLGSVTLEKVRYPALISYSFFFHFATACSRRRGV